MNWKSITIEPGFIKQDTIINGNKVMSYIPLSQVDSFGVMNSERKLWLYLGSFFALIAFVSIFASNSQNAFLLGVVSATFFAVYLLTRKTWLSITSNQVKFSVEVMTTEQEVKDVNEFILEIKRNIQLGKIEEKLKAA